MSVHLPSSGLKTSVCAMAAVTITALMAWSVDAYVGQLHRNGDPSAFLAQIDSGTPTSDHDTVNG